MALFNYATKEITIKIVYYGPGLSGKTTNLQHLHSILNPDTKGKLLSLATEADRTLFFDFLPVELGRINDFSIRFQLYTVPGQVRYNATRKLVLKGADAIVFVADSQREMKEQNIESLLNMRENLVANNINPEEIPVILQYNKRDLKNVLPVEDLNRDLNQKGRYTYTESVALDGTGVEDTFQQITRMVLKGIAKKHRIQVATTDEDMAGEEPLPPGSGEMRDPFADPQATTVHDEQKAYGEVELPHPLDRIDTEPEPPPPQAREVPETAPRQVPVREVREVPVIPDQKLDSLMEMVAEMLTVLKEMNQTLAGIRAETKEIKIEGRKNHNELRASLRELHEAFKNLKTKKSWFRFS
jgi:signal recognition particle receptor subunit beta